MALSESNYHDVFVKSGLVSEEDFVRASEDASAGGRFIEAVIVDLGMLTDEEVGKVMAAVYGVDFINLLQIEAEPDVVRMIPDVIIRKQWIIPYAVKRNILSVAVVDPQNIELLDFIEKKVGMPLQVGYVTPGIFEDALRSYSEDIVSQIQAFSEQFEKMHHEHPNQKITGSEDAHVLEIVDLILQYGYANGASDIHIEPKNKLALVRYRIDGVLHDIVKLSPGLDALIVSRIKIMANLRTDEHLAAQDGKFRVHFGNKQVDVRVSILPVVEGEKIVLRVLSEKGHTFTLSTLGFSDSDFERVKKAVMKPHGMILSTGPTGSGKTTSMYATMKLLNSREVNIQTIEDPIEYELEGINQIQVNLLTDLTFANGLRSIVRQDPDIIMVGEIRDKETADISVNAAMTGHLVLSTLHTNDAATAIPRLLDLKVEPFLIASCVNLVIGQRLVRHICKNCSAPISIDADKLKEMIPLKLYEKYFNNKKSVRFFEGKGCLQCNKTGFSGRVGIFEVLEITEAIRELVMQRANADVIAHKASEEGMTSMFEDGISKALTGITTLDEVVHTAVSL